MNEPTILEKQSARRGLAVYFIALILGSIFFEWKIIQAGESVGQSPWLLLDHGAVNAIIQGTFDRATVGTPQAVGESGWLTAISAVVIVLLVTRGRWKLQRRPGEPLPIVSGQSALLSRSD